jgi:hypothetical protein
VIHGSGGGWSCIEPLPLPGLELVQSILGDRSSGGLSTAAEMSAVISANYAGSIGGRAASASKVGVRAQRRATTPRITPRARARPTVAKGF